MALKDRVQDHLNTTNRLMKNMRDIRDKAQEGSGGGKWRRRCSKLETIANDLKYLIETWDV